MESDKLIEPHSVLTGVRVATKTAALLKLAQEAASRTGLHERGIFDALVERERLGSTGIGAGTAVPHARLSELDGLCVIFARLDRPIDFESVDEQPVDLIILLLSPEAAGADHLKALSRAARLLRNDALCRKLRRATDPAGVRTLLTTPCDP